MYYIYLFLLLKALGFQKMLFHFELI